MLLLHYHYHHHSHFLSFYFILILINLLFFPFFLQQILILLLSLFLSSWQLWLWQWSSSIIIIAYFYFIVSFIWYEIICRMIQLKATITILMFWLLYPNRLIIMMTLVLSSCHSSIWFFFYTSITSLWRWILIIEFVTLLVIF